MTGLYNIYAGVRYFVTHKISQYMHSYESSLKYTSMSSDGWSMDDPNRESLI